VSNELIISSTDEGERIALLQDRRLIEYHTEEKSNAFTVGDIYLGSVKKVNPGMNAAFVDIGHEKDAFLHYLDLGPQIRSLNKYVKLVQNKMQTTPFLDAFEKEEDIEKTGKIQDVLTKQQAILVQVVKEPISSKGPRLGCELSLAGRYLVLVPFSEAVSISKKIVQKDERSRLLQLVKSVKPAHFGVIIRTVAEGKELDEIEKDLRTLIQKWENGFEKLITANPKDKIIGEGGRANTMLRDMLNPNFESILTDSKEVYDDLKEYLRASAPDLERIVKFHKGPAKLFEHAGIEKQLKSLFGKTVSLQTGGYLVIEHTEALHVIDVNSGSTSAKTNTEDQEETALNVNLEAAKEVARQLRLRDMGGIIVVDFIDMRKIENKKLVYDRMKDEMKTERAKYTILPLSKFGLMQITRQRVRPERAIITSEVCPTCNGTGTVQASIVVADQIDASHQFLIEKQNERNLKLALHPFLFAYYTKGGLVSRQMKWFWKYKTWTSVIEDSSLGLTDFRFSNQQGQAIELGRS
jgi:ribonuclease G